MGEKATLFRGVVRNGVVVFEGNTPLPEGTTVSVTVEPVTETAPPGVMAFTPEEQSEFDAWDKLSAEAFQMIIDLEREELNEGR